MSIMQILKLDITVEMSGPVSLQMPAFPIITCGFTFNIDVDNGKNEFNFLSI